MKGIFSFLLLIMEAGSLFFFFLNPASPLTGMEPLGLFFLVLVLFGGLVLVETALAGWVAGAKCMKCFLPPVTYTHLFWVFSWAWPWARGVNLPEPHNLDQRKFQVLLGVMLISHLFAYTAWLLKKASLNSRPISKTFGIVGAFFFIATTLWTASVCDLSGDEPHYLLMDYSLIHDGDLDLSNNYQNKDYLSFYKRGELALQGLDYTENGKIYSFHPLGPVLLALPGFAIGGRLGAALTMSILAAMTLFLSLRILEALGAHGPPLQAVGWVGVFSSPVLIFSGLIYPEIPTALFVALILFLFLKKRWGWLGVCLGMLLWIHNRNVLLVMPFLAVLGYELLKGKNEKREKILRFTWGFLAPTFLLAFYFEKIYGVLTPLGAHHESFFSLFSIQRFFAGFFGLILDQDCGLWFHFPVFALIVTGGILLRRSNNPLKSLVLIPFCFFYLFMSFYENLGLAPATRYMVGITPLLWMMLYPAFERIKAWDFWAQLTFFSFAAGFAVNWLLCAVPWIRYNKIQGGNWILIIAGNYLHLPLVQWEPMFQVPAVEMKSYFLGAFWVLVTIAFSVLFLKAEANKTGEGKNF